jgi:prolyl-tRNA synthetase
MAAVNQIKTSLGQAVRWQVDDREGYTAGWKFNEWELRGVPLRVEIGPRDVANTQVVLARRDIPGREGKRTIPMSQLAQTVETLLEEIQHQLFQKALQFREDHTHEPKDYAEFQAIVENGFARAYWCGETACEKAIQEETKATNRCIPLEQLQAQPNNQCIYCGKPAKEKAIFARAY